MKLLIFIAYLLIFINGVFCQPRLDSSFLVARLTSEIRNCQQIETRYIGGYGHLSAIFKKVDSLKNAVSKESFMNYFDSSSYVLKFYTYFPILINNDSLAFKKLKDNINDTNKIDHDFAGNWSGSIKFNELLAAQYLAFIRAKYYSALRGTCCLGQTYYFDKKDLKKWRLKSSEFYKLIGENILDKNRIEYYSR